MTLPKLPVPLRQFATQFPGMAILVIRAIQTAHRDRDEEIGLFDDAWPPTTQATTGLATALGPKRVFSAGSK